MSTIVLAEITVHDPTVPGDVVLRFTTGNGYIHPTAPGPYEDRILGQSRFTRQIFADGRTFGASQMDYGRLLVANLDAGLDWLVEHGCAADDRPARLLVGDGDGPYGDFEPLFTGTVEQMLCGFDQVEFVFRDDFAAIVDKTLQSHTYGGTNALPAGLDGTPDDLKDRCRPDFFGAVKNVSVPIVNTSKLTVEFRSRGGSHITATNLQAVYDKGAPPVNGKGTQRANAAALQAATVGAGQWDYSIGSASEGVYGQLSSIPLGQVTADLIEGATSADRTIAQIWKRILTDRAGIAAGDINAADVTAADTASPYEVGIWAGVDPITIRDALDAITASDGYWYGPDATGEWRLKQVLAPETQTPVATFRRFGLNTPTKDTDGDIISLRPVFVGREQALPAAKVTVRGRRNWTVQNRDALSGVAQTRLAWLEREYRETSTPEDAAVKALHPLAPTLTFGTLLTDADDELAVATRLQALFGVPRRFWEMRVKLSAARDPGDYVAVVYPRAPFAGGKTMLITKIGDFNPVTLIADCIVWG